VAQNTFITHIYKLEKKAIKEASTNLILSDSGAEVPITNNFPLEDPEKLEPQSQGVLAEEAGLERVVGFTEKVDQTLLKEDVDLLLTSLKLKTHDGTEKVPTSSQPLETAQQQTQQLDLDLQTSTSHTDSRSTGSNLNFEQIPSDTRSVPKLTTAEKQLQQKIRKQQWKKTLRLRS
jgi:hypothetical protein